MKTRMALLALLGLVTVLRWLWLAPQELTPGGSYLALCGYAPSIAYFDGPGGTAVCVAQGIRWMGAGALGAAFLWPVFAVLATLALYHLVAPLAGERAAGTSAVMLNLVPAFNHAALHPSCALPVAAFALGFAACAWRALNRQQLAWWLAAGLCAAGGLWFDYLAVFFLPALFVMMLASHRWRLQILEPGFWLAVLPPVGVFAWLLAWNAEHGWVHFIGGTWQTALGVDFRNAPRAIYRASLGATPIILAVILGGAFFALRELTKPRRAAFLVIPAAVAFLLAAYLALRGEAASAAGLTALALALPLVAWLPIPTFVMAALITVAGLWAGLAVATDRPTPPDVNAEVARQVEDLRRANTTDPSAPVFLIARDAALASALALHLPDTSFVPAGHPPVYVVESPYADSQYALWPRYDQFVDAPQAPSTETLDPFTEQDGANPFLWRSALFITPQTPDELPQAVTAAFAAHRLVGEVTAPSGEILRVYLCSEYETLPL